MNNWLYFKTYDANDICDGCLRYERSTWLHDGYIYDVDDVYDECDMNDLCDGYMMWMIYVFVDVYDAMWKKICCN